MSKLITLSLLATSAILLGGCTKTDPAEQSTTQKMNEAAEFAAAIQSGKPTRCDMTKGENTMTYYIEGKKMRADMNNMVGEGVEAKKMVSHMINDGTVFYMWADGEKNGTKMTVPTEAETKQMAEDAKKYQAENPAAPKFESETDYNSLKDEGYTITCKSTMVDTALLTPPKDVTFVDPTEMMKKVSPTGSGAALDMEKLQEMAKQYGAGAADGE